MVKIGFRSYDNEDKSSSNDEQSSGISAKEQFRQFVKSKYEAFGPSANIVFKSSRDLAYECREMCSPSLPDIATVMTEVGFKSDQFCGQYTWVLYEKEQLLY